MTWKTALVALVLVTGCGINKEQHQKALDEQRRALTTECQAQTGAARGELEQAKAALAKANGDLEAERAKSTKSVEDSAALQRNAQLYKATAQLREAQVATLEKRFPEALKLADEAGQVVKAQNLEAAQRALDEAAAGLNKKDVKASAKLGEAAGFVAAAAR